ncbi:RHS domain-containing protein, partial [Escherichia albertii]|uniref:RHS repeat-associated core domain-containing protein n=1 Tax=Escherichia albertii TaxID=208962 RepID=UPI0021D415B3
AEYIPERRLHLYHCDHRGLPQALISPEGETAWRGEYDEWGNLLGEEKPQHLQQPYRLSGQQYDEESGLYYNRNRYYDPLQGRYITQDPIGLEGGWNLYQYPLNPTTEIDPLALCGEDSIEQSGPSWFIADPMDKYRQQAVMGLTKWWNDTAPQRTFYAVMQAPDVLVLMSAANNKVNKIEAKQRQEEYRKYKDRCNQSPPPNLDLCSEAKWKLSRNKDCRDMRKAWDDKWRPGKHEDSIAQLEAGINKLETFITEECQ